MPKCVVVCDGDFDWQGDKPLNYPLRRSILYEAHVKGFTQSPTSGTSQPGTYRGFIEKIPYLKKLGVTSVEFLPLHEFDEHENKNVNPQTGEPLKNFWGYSTVAFFAPKASYAASDEHNLVGCHLGGVIHADNGAAGNPKVAEFFGDFHVGLWNFATATNPATRAKTYRKP